jgi:poly [ADP-ribose] polymerase 2/3/4
VLMGSEFRPGKDYDPKIPALARTTKNKFGKPWNSINVRPSHGGVRNHEAIVWNVDQIRVRYLCEFDAR